MKCKTTYNSERVKKISIDCSKCESGGSLDSPECMRKAIDLIRMNQVEEIKFVRRDYSEVYTKKEVDLLAEVVDVIKEFEDKRIWLEISCGNREEEERFRRFVVDILDCFYANPVTAYEMLVGVMEEYLRMLDRTPSGVSVPCDVRPVDESREKIFRPISPCLKR